MPVSTGIVMDVPIGGLFNPFPSQIAKIRKELDVSGDGVVYCIFPLGPVFLLHL